MIIYMYLASTWVQIITLFNYFDSLILYNILLKILKKIKVLNIVFIKKQILNYKFIHT